MKQLVKKYPEVAGMLEMLVSAKTMSLGSLYAACDMDKAAFKRDVLPKLLQKGVLEVYYSMYKVNVTNVLHELEGIGRKVSTVRDVQTLEEFCKLPKVDMLIKAIVSGTRMRATAVADILEVTKQDANVLLIMLTRKGVLKTTAYGAYVVDNVTELCRLAGIDSNDAGIDSHSKSIISWDHFEYQPHLIQAIISVTTIGPNGREPETVKAVQLATTLGVSKKEFVTRYAPTLVQKGLIAQAGNAYTKGPRIREYIEELTKMRQDTARERRQILKDAGEDLDEADLADEQYENIQHIIATGDERRAERLKKETPAQRKEREKRRAKLVASSVAKMEKRRAVELKDASDWHKAKMLTSGEYKQRTKDINDQYDEMIKNLKGE